MSDFFSFYTLFELVCFSLLVWFFVRIFKRKGIDALKDGIARAQEVVKHLKNREEDLKEACQKAAQKTQEQEQLAKNLLQRIDQWQKAEHEKSKQLEHERILCQGRMKQYSEDQQNWVIYHKIEQKLLPEAFIQAEQELKTRFKTAQEQELFLQHMVNQLKGGQQ